MQCIQPADSIVKTIFSQLTMASGPGCLVSGNVISISSELPGTNKLRRHSRRPSIKLNVFE